MPAHKPVLSVFLSSRGAPPALSAGPRGQLLFYRFPENAAQALAAVHYGRWRARPRGILVTLSPFAHSAVRAVIDRVLEGVVEPLWVQAADLVTVLRVVGIECAVAEQTTSHEASSTAERLGYSLVAKALSPDVPYKSDVGGVLLGLDSVAAVTPAVGTLVERFEKLGARLDGILLQHEIPGGLEALVVCGWGGTLVEILHDIAFRLPPATDLDAAEMLARLRATRLLDGYRGLPQQTVWP
jgi:acyl-CoA synthetase (NDP forming)